MRRVSRTRQRRRLRCVRSRERERALRPRAPPAGGRACDEGGNAAPSWSRAVSPWSGPFSHLLKIDKMRHSKTSAPRPRLSPSATGACRRRLSLTTPPSHLHPEEQKPPSDPGGKGVAVAGAVPLSLFSLHSILSPFFTRPAAPRRRRPGQTRPRTRPRESRGPRSGRGPRRGLTIFWSTIWLSVSSATMPSSCTREA